jgi:hypothetical protein
LPASANRPKESVASWSMQMGIHRSFGCDKVGGKCKWSDVGGDLVVKGVESIRKTICALIQGYKITKPRRGKEIP